jgi:hypothetical protein
MSTAILEYSNHDMKSIARLGTDPDLVQLRMMYFSPAGLSGIWLRPFSFRCGKRLYLREKKLSAWFTTPKTLRPTDYADFSKSG